MPLSVNGSGLLPLSPVDDSTGHDVPVVGGTSWGVHWRRRLRQFSRDSKPFLKFERRMANRAAFHRCDKVQHVTANAPAACSGTRIGMARPRILVGIHDESLAATLRSVGRQRTAAPQVGTIYPPQHHAIAGYRHLH